MLHSRLGTVPAALKIASDYCATANPLVQKAYNLSNCPSKSLDTHSEILHTASMITLKLEASLQCERGQ